MKQSSADKQLSNLQPLLVAGRGAQLDVEEVRNVASFHGGRWRHHAGDDFLLVVQLGLDPVDDAVHGVLGHRLAVEVEQIFLAW